MKVVASFAHFVTCLALTLGRFMARPMKLIFKNDNFATILKTNPIHGASFDLVYFFPVNKAAHNLAFLIVSIFVLIVLCNKFHDYSPLFSDWWLGCFATILLGADFSGRTQPCQFRFCVRFVIPALTALLGIYAPEFFSCWKISRLHNCFPYRDCD